MARFFGSSKKMWPAVCVSGLLSRKEVLCRRRRGGIEHPGVRQAKLHDSAIALFRRGAERLNTGRQVLPKAPNWPFVEITSPSGHPSALARLTTAEAIASVMLHTLYR